MLVLLRLNLLDLVSQAGVSILECTVVGQAQIFLILCELRLLHLLRLMLLIAQYLKIFLILLEVLNLDPDEVLILV